MSGRRDWASWSFPQRVLKSFGAALVSGRGWRGRQGWTSSGSYLWDLEMDGLRTWGKLV